MHGLLALHQKGMDPVEGVGIQIEVLGVGSGADVRSDLVGMVPWTYDQAAFRLGLLRKHLISKDGSFHMVIEMSRHNGHGDLYLRRDAA